jgi:hypothetical protein
MPKKGHSKNNGENKRSHPARWTVSRAAVFVLLQDSNEPEEDSQRAKIRQPRAKKLTCKSSSENFGHLSSGLERAMELGDSDSA